MTGHTAANSFQLLAGSNRVALPRHQTLRALIDWSYDLLPGDEHALLRRLAIFSGGWTLDATEQVIPADPAAITTLLQQLVEKSLVVPHEQNGTMRYYMLETIRRYALEKLGEAAEVEIMADRHLQYIVVLAGKIEPQLYTAEQAPAIYRFNREADNIRAALSWAQQSNQMETGIHLVGLLWYYWFIAGYAREGWQWMNAFLPALDQAAPAVRARMLLGLARLAPFAGEYKRAAQYAGQSLSLYRALGDKRGIARALLSFNLGSAHKEELANITAMRAEALALCREIGDSRMLGQAQVENGVIAIELNEYRQAWRAFEEALQLFRQVGDTSRIGLALAHLGNAALYQGEYSRAEALFLESIQIARQLGDDLRLAYSIAGLGTAALNRDRPLAAFKYYHESYAIRQKLGEKHAIVVTLFGMGNAVRQLGKLEQARTYYRQAITICHTYRLNYLVAEAIEAFASLDARLNRPIQAARLLGAADTIRRITDRPRKLPWQAAFDTHLALIHSQIDAQSFEQAWAEGQALTLEQAVASTLEEAGSSS